MLNKKNRLAKDREIKRVFARGRVFLNSAAALKFLRLPGETESRFAIVVSTKVSKKAARRNRLKRLVREELRRKIKFLPKGDYALSLRPAAEKLEEGEFIGIISQLLAKTAGEINNIRK